MAKKKKLDVSPALKKKAVINAIFSAFIWGTGQFRNKQNYKGYIFLGVFLLLIGIELLTGSYQYYSSEIVSNPAGTTGFYFFRDYGGFFTKGLWGFLTLGAVPMMKQYRGIVTQVDNPVIPWQSADNSVTLLGNGIIAIVILTLFLAIWIYNIIDAYRSTIYLGVTQTKVTFKEWIGSFWETGFAYVILAPSLGLMALFTVVPFLFSFLLAFTDYTYKTQVPLKLIHWVGFDTFGQLVGDPGWLLMFGKIFAWTLVYAIMASVTCYVVGFIQALIVNSKYVRGKKFWRMILIIPWALPAMITNMVFKNAFDKDGLVNQFLTNFHLMDNVSHFLHTIGLQGQADMPIYWLTADYNGLLAKAVVLMVNLWLGAPYFMMLIIGVLNTIPTDLYEAADIDGAKPSQRFRFITLPLTLKGTIPVIIMTFTFNFNNFGAIYFLTGGGPAFPLDQVPQSMKVLGGVPGQTDILISWIYKISFSMKGQELYNVAAMYSIIIFLMVGGFAVYNLSKSKGTWED